MSTKFVSKNSNYMVVLKPGVEGSRALGTHSVSGLYVKFQAGIVDIKEQSIVEQLRNHPGFGIDFLEVKENEIDPYESVRDESEPAHIISEIKYGHVEKRTGTPLKTKLSPQMKKLIEGEAIKMLPGLLKSNPKILKDIITSMAADMKEKEETSTENSITEEPIKKGPGRPKVE